MVNFSIFTTTFLWNVQPKAELLLDSNSVFEYVCPKCGAKTRFHRHGTYLRSVTYFLRDGTIVFEPIEILRLKCLSCHATHSILPGDLIPFQVYSLPVVLFLRKQILIEKNSLHYTIKKTHCTLQTIYQKLQLLKRNVILIEYYLRQVSLYTKTVLLPLKQALILLLSPSMKVWSYFQCHGQPLFLNRRTTISYPFYCAAAKVQIYI